MLAIPGVPPHVGQRYAEEVFWIAIDPGTYRSLTLGRGLSPDDFENWINNFYERRSSANQAARRSHDRAISTSSSWQANDFAEALTSHPPRRSLTSATRQRAEGTITAPPDTPE